jgi:Holliday junction resolvasome RuvABC endonuclease subunit
MSSRPEGVGRLKNRPSAGQLTMLGIDPGLSNTGYAVARVDVSARKIVKTLELGTIQTERETAKTIRRTSDDLRRARKIHRELRAVVERHSIAVAACEMQSTAPYKRISLNFGVTLGVIASFDFFLIELLARDVKKAVTGDRDAAKEKIIRWALEVTRNDDVHWPTSARQNRMDLSYRARHVSLGAEHQADALAVIHAALQTGQMQDLFLLQGAITI